ncbi:hypothetical protein KLP40_14655 [Hymenobacter sp. NST-14]|uniref:hypothetical protein n=1 Tax=Hymenobacter piscis TaxID=2839984 RepID=UPI001C027CBA|nr:hypothetical protein [Hymenobacter piscis]MBT9394409.1 hypothetical protein [Hymenobacter piscis]
MMQLIPAYLVRDVSQLLTSRDQFLTGRKRSSADLTELKELYSQLEGYWEELTWQNKTRHIGSLRQRARNLLRDLKRDEESEKHDLRKKYDREWRDTEQSLSEGATRLRNTRKKYEADNELYQQRKSAWESRLETEKRSLHACYHTWKAEHSALAETWAADVAALESRLQTLNDVLRAFENNTPSESEKPWTERRNYLISKQSSLEQKKKNLQKRRQDLEQRKQRLSEVQQSEYQTSSDLSSITRKCKELKRELVAQGLLSADEFPEIRLPFQS